MVWFMLPILCGLGLAFGVNADVRTSDFADLYLGTWAGVGNLQANDDVCIAIENADVYSVLVSGSGSMNEFVLSNGSSWLNIEVFYNDDAGVNGANQLTPGVVLSGQTIPQNKKVKPKKSADDCKKRLNANVSVRVSESALAKASPGNYFGSLTLTIIPE